MNETFFSVIADAPAAKGSPRRPYRFQNQEEFQWDNNPPPPLLGDNQNLPGIDEPMPSKGKGMTGCGFILGVIFSITIVGAGLGVLGLGGFTYLTYAGSDDWVQANGEIDSAEVEVSSSDDGDTYFARINYTYYVQDEPYKSDRVYFGYGGNWEMSSSGDGAYELVEEYPRGKEVIVYYDPDDPSMSVLEKRANSIVYILMGVGVAMILGGFFGFISTLARGLARLTRMAPIDNSRYQ